MSMIRWTGVLALLLSCSGCDAGGSSEKASKPGALRGCGTKNKPPVAPGGYYTNGASVCREDGTPHLFRGVARPSFEWSANGDHISEDDFRAMAAWHANVVRIALNQDFWLERAALHDAGYVDRVDQAVKQAEAAGLDVILDLHWSDRGDLSVSTTQGGQDKPGICSQQPMADKNSKQFWIEVATKYKDDGHVLFELYNEPHSVTWDAWLKGGSYAEYQVVGMQELYNAIRSTGADNVVIAGGLNYAFDLSNAANYSIQGYNVMYASHPYNKSDNAQSKWELAFGYLASKDIAPVITTEFGDGSANCTGDWDSALIQYNDVRHISWTAWAWYASGCNFPALISDWSYTPTLQGAAVKAILLGYDYQPAGRPSAPTGSGGAGASGGGSGNGGTSASGGSPGAAGASDGGGGSAGSSDASAGASQ